MFSQTFPGVTEPGVSRVSYLIKSLRRQDSRLPRSRPPVVGSVLAIYSFGMGCLIALFGGFAGAVVSIVFAVAFLRWAGEADALVWTAMFAFFCLFGIPLGAGLAYWRWRARRRARLVGPS